MIDDSMTADDAVGLRAEATSWAPPEDVPRHAGVPIEPDADFFADPPPEIGEVLSAESSLKTTKTPWRVSSRIVLAGLVAWAGAMALQLFIPDWLWAALLFAVLAPVVWLATGFSHTCTYVGRLGVARFRCKGSRSRVRPPEVLRFEDATELRTSQTRHYHNGVYTGTSYAFVWSDAEGKKRFKLSGTYRGEKAPPKPKDPFHFAVMSETAWTLFLLAESERELEANGSIRFALKSGHWVAVGPGFLDLNLPGVPEHRLPAGEVGEVAFEQGVIKIKRVDAKEGWFSSSGVYKLQADAMANFRLFGMVYSRLMADADRGEGPPGPRAEAQ